MMIIYIAGLQSVPEDMLEAAKIDGATRSQTLFKVIIPNVMPSITICTFLTLTNSFKLFDQNLALTGGLPQVIDKAAKMKINMSELLALNIYSTTTSIRTITASPRPRRWSSLSWLPYWPWRSRPLPVKRRCSSNED